MAAIDFETLKLRRRPNKFLLAPPDLCKNAKPQANSRVYDVPVQTLHDAFLAVAKRQPRTTLSAQHVDGEQFVQKSRIFGFPDLIDVKFIPIDDTHATLAVYSRAIYGRRDFRVNEGRVKVWIAELESELKK